MIAPKDHAYGLLTRGCDSLSDKYKALESDLAKMITKWHEAHDDEEK